MAKFLITTIQVNCVALIGFGKKFTQIVVIKITAISWLPPWISHLFHHGFVGGHRHSLQLDCFRLDFTSFCNCLL